MKYTQKRFGYYVTEDESEQHYMSPKEFFKTLLLGLFICFLVLLGMNLFGRLMCFILGA